MLCYAPAKWISFVFFSSLFVRLWISMHRCWRIKIEVNLILNIERVSIIDFYLSAGRNTKIIALHRIMMQYFIAQSMAKRSTLLYFMIALKNPGCILPTSSKLYMHRNSVAKVMWITSKFLLPIKSKTEFVLFYFCVLSSLVCNKIGRKTRKRYVHCFTCCSPYVNRKAKELKISFVWIDREWHDFYWWNCNG